MCGEPSVVLSFNGSEMGSLYSDSFPFEELGEIEISRASTIEWDNDEGLWVAVIEKRFRKNTNYTYKNKSREACIKWERRYINESTN